MTTTELVPATMAGLEALAPALREIAVTQYLTDARDRLAFALEATGPAAVAAIKAEIATAAEATKQLGLSREIRQDAQEMERRAEYTLGKAIRVGQERGEIQRQKDNRHTLRNGLTDSLKPSPIDFAASHELHGVHGAGFIYAMAEATEAEFDAALADARAEGNLSRANVARNVKGVKSNGLTPVEKLIKVRELAPTGRTSGQIAKEIGASEDYVRRIAREAGIEITADKALGRSRRVDSNQIVAGTVEAASIPTAALELIDFSDLDRECLGEWISSLSESIKTLRALRSRLEKELSQ
jgi:hypothetical protein